MLYLLLLEVYSLRLRSLMSRCPFCWRTICEIHLRCVFLPHVGGRLHSRGIDWGVLIGEDILTQLKRYLGSIRIYFIGEYSSLRDCGATQFPTFLKEGVTDR